MSKPVVEVQVRAVVATSSGYAVFLGNEDKVFVMFVDQDVGMAIGMFMEGAQKERPLTHDLLANILRALGAKIERVIVNDLKQSIYFARLVLSAENESQHKKIIEIDARPSDCIAMATQQRAPIYVSLDVWEEVEDARGRLADRRERPARGFLEGGRTPAKRSTIALPFASSPSERLGVPSHFGAASAGAAPTQQEFLQSCRSWRLIQRCFF
jgi:uncharacterized protein